MSKPQLSKSQLSDKTWMEDLVREYPRAPSFLRERGVVCIQCGEPVWGTLGEVIAEKGLDPKVLIPELIAFLAEEG